MTQGFVQLPQDGSGKKLNARHRLVAGNDVYEQYVIALPNDRIRTAYQSFASAANTYAATAPSAGTSPHLVENDTGSLLLLAVTRIVFASQITTAAAFPTAPRVIAKLFTFSGTPSGSVVTGASFDSADTKSSGWNARSATTGMTVTEGATVHSFLPVSAATGVGAVAPTQMVWEARPNCPIILRAGQGLLLRQSSNADTSDTRIWTATIEVEEYTAA